MATALRQEVAVEEEVASQDAPVVNNDAVLINDAINKIKSHQEGIDNAVGKAALDTVFHYTRIGIELNHLHSQFKRGEWEVRVEQETGHNKTTVQRLRKLANSSLDGRIRTLGPDLKTKVPLDIQKLVMLIKLPEDKKPFCEFFERFDPATMSRSDLRAAINEILGAPKSKDGKSKKKRSKSSTSRMTKAMQSNASPIEQLFAACGEPIVDLTASVSKQLDEGQVDQDSIVKAEAAVDHALECLNKLKKAIKEKLAA